MERRLPSRHLPVKSSSRGGLTGCTLSSIYLFLLTAELQNCLFPLFAISLFPETHTSQDFTTTPPKLLKSPRTPHGSAPPGSAWTSSDGCLSTCSLCVCLQDPQHTVILNHSSLLLLHALLGFSQAAPSIPTEVHMGHNFTGSCGQHELSLEQYK